ncbi:DUF5606 domain-containing protein [Arcicella rosea]|uniref:DUF5606 domain-containing protein n=1 Tax=Arcicella rosea TaxID=502909 RepID=A0A841F1S7_9BACT|nr:DUF5606 domain-containing protein [Arcicella rosea]MBB6005751.1 hypothetical protein [Arcicella rosea]
MELLKEIANISGQSGLYRILKPTRTGVIVESLDGKKTRSVVGANARVSVLKDISVYIEDHQDAALPLANIFLKIRETHGEKVELNTKNATEADLFDFLATVVPNFDRERVHGSDVKKMISWYNIISANLPEAFEVEAVTVATEEEAKTEEA